MYTISNLRSMFRLGIPIVCFGLSISHLSFLKSGPIVPKKPCRLYVNYTSVPPISPFRL
ncbi:hypothetical protein LguiA_011853 [Lonicera macranthoides]